MNATITATRITVSEGKVCLPSEILTIAQSAKRGLLLEVKSEKGKAYSLLLRNGKDNTLQAIHKCFAVTENKPCKHLRSAIMLTEKWLNTKLPREVLVDNRWLTKEESVAIKDLTPSLMDKPGEFKTIKL